MELRRQPRAQSPFPTYCFSRSIDEAVETAPPVGTRMVRRHRSMAGGSRRRQGLPATEEPAASRERQENRGYRVLLLRLPALQRPRAHSAGLVEDAAARR